MSPVNVTMLILMELHLIQILEDAIQDKIISESQAGHLSEKIYGAICDIDETLS